MFKPGFPRSRVHRSTAKLICDPHNMCIVWCIPQYAHVVYKLFLYHGLSHLDVFLPTSWIFSVGGSVTWSIFPICEHINCAQHVCNPVPLLCKHTQKNIPILCGCYKMSTEARVEAIQKNCISITACVLSALPCVRLCTIHMHQGVINHPHVYGNTPSKAFVWMGQYADNFLWQYNY